MKQPVAEHLPWPRKLAAACLAIVGLVVLVGSGGGIGIGFPPLGEVVVGPLPPPPVASINPTRVTAQVGSPVSFSASTTNLTAPISYRWCRVAASGGACVEVAGAITAMLTLPAVNLSDDGASYRLTATGPEGTALAVTTIAVSAAPPVIIADGEFAVADWSATSLGEPSNEAATALVTRSDSGGNPGAMLGTAMVVTTIPSSIQVFHMAAQALYEPAVSGAIHVIDMSMDCRTAGANAGFLVPFTAALLDQAGRRYLAVPARRSGCNWPTWRSQATQSSLKASDFQQVAGPACGAGQSCPDFGPQAAPIRPGYALLAAFPVGTTTGTMTYDADNWKFSFWRR